MGWQSADPTASPPVHLDGEDFGDEAEVVEGLAALGVPHAEAARGEAGLVAWECGVVR